MSKFGLNQFVAAMALVCSANVYAGGNITFGGVPAVGPAPVAGPQGAGAQNAPGGTDQLPGFTRAIMYPVTPAESESAIWSRSVPANLNPGVAMPAQRAKAAMTRKAANVAPVGPASIVELARALNNDPDLIYEYVRNNIEYNPMWGIQKGALGTILDNRGTAFDQSALMIALLRQAGYTASYVVGAVNLTASQVHDWFGVDTTNVCAVANLLGNGQIPIYSLTASAGGNCPGSTASLVSANLAHIWVKVMIGGTAYYFDPSYKPHTIQTGLNLASITGYNSANYLSAATSGSTITTDYVQGCCRRPKIDPL